MSRSPRTLSPRPHRHAPHTCLGCRAHRARYRYRGRVRADRDHTLCFRCFRAEVNRLRALGMREGLLVSRSLTSRLLTSS